MCRICIRKSQRREKSSRFQKNKIPAPRFLVFYNGREDYPDRVVMKLSEMYGKKEKNPALELGMIILNINEGHNKALMDACRTLREYASTRQRSAGMSGREISR